MSVSKENVQRLTHAINAQAAGMTMEDFQIALATCLVSAAYLQTAHEAEAAIAIV